MIQSMLMFAMLNASPPPVAPSGYKYVWGDDFNYEGHPNPKKWGYEVGKVRNGEAQYYTLNRLQNAIVHNGMLTIRGIKEPYKGSEYSSASVTSFGKFSFEFGRVDVKARVPFARGTWPAIWMLGSDIPEVGWPRCGEIDIMEHVGHIPNKIYGTLHMYDQKTGHFSYGKQIDIPDSASAFHIYSMEWSPKEITLLVDNQVYVTYPFDDPAHWDFDRPMYLILNLAIGGSWGGQKGIDDSAFPQKMDIKYVHVFQKE